MDERSQRMLRLLQVVAHDIRNPLGVAQLKAEVMKRKPPTEPEKLAKDLDVIMRNTAQIAKLVDELVDVASIEAGGIDVEKGRHDLQAILEEARASHGERVELAPPISIEVSCERERILQVLTTLISQAIAASSGKVLVSATLADELTITVEDAREKVSDPHQHFDRWAHGKSGGFGLTIARGIVVAHGGRMWLETPEAGGAKISFTLPPA